MSQEDRIIALEEQLAHQALTIEELSDALSAQWKKIDQLSRKVEEITEQVTVHEEAIGEAFPVTKPPHY